MTSDTANAAFVRDVQAELGVKVDGWAGPATRAAFAERFGVELETAPPAAFPWPGRSESEIRDYYGPPGDSQQVRVEPPYPMRIAWDTATPLRVITCHRLVADSLLAVLRSILDTYGMDWIRRHGLDLYGGCYNFRKMRGGSSWSAHAWGIAIDLDPARNGLRTPWPGEATMPVEAIELFEAAGWTSLGRVIHSDAMHFQATRW